MNITEKRTEIILKNLMDKQDVTVCSKYGEPGYEDPDISILFGNWNNISGQVIVYLETAGFELEWSDEWVIDSEHDKCFRCSPSGYEWKPSYICDDWTNGEIVAIADIESDDDLADEYINDYLLNDYKHVSKADIDKHLIRLGFETGDETFQNGFHAHMDDQPEAIYKGWSDKGFDVVFSGYDPSQFYVEFKIHVRKREQNDES